MPSFLNKLKSGADKAAFEAERLVRLNQAQAAVRTAQRELEAETAALGREALALYDGGVLVQPELLASCEKIEGLRQRVSELEAEVERIREEKPPEASEPARDAAAAEVPEQAPPPAQIPPAQPAATAAPEPQPAAPAPQGRACPNCGNPLRPGVRFCPECGTRIEEG